MPEIVIDDMQDGYREWVDYVRTNGTPRSPRGIPTVNVRDLTVVLRNPERSLTEHIGRKASTKLAALEALQLVGGASYPDVMTKVAPNTEQFLNVYGTFNGAYGTRVNSTTHLVIERLLQDRDTRQAVLTIFDTKKDLGTPDNKDVACTVALLFELDGERLHCKAVMRSNDVMWGVAHDVFMFTTLQRTIAEFIEVEVGEYRHSAYSSHFYLRDEATADAMHAPTQLALPRPSLWQPEFGVAREPGDTFTLWRDGPRARSRHLIEYGRDPWWEGSWWETVASTWSTWTA